MSRHHRRHTERQRRKFAEYASANGNIKVSRLAGVKVATVRRWRREFGYAGYEILSHVKQSERDTEFREMLAEIGGGDSVSCCDHIEESKAGESLMRIRDDLLDDVCGLDRYDLEHAAHSISDFLDGDTMSQVVRLAKVYGVENDLQTCWRYVSRLRLTSEQAQELAHHPNGDTALLAEYVLNDMRQKEDSQLARANEALADELCKVVDHIADAFKDICIDENISSITLDRSARWLDQLETFAKDRAAGF